MSDDAIVDPGRDRRIPYRVYAPVGLVGDVPLILVSHGGTGSDTGYLRGGHLGSAFAEGGFLAIHIGHVESDPGRRPVEDRPADVTFVLDRLEAGEFALPAAFVGVPDLERVGHAGHSFGAYTSHAVGGAVFAEDRSDDRIDAIAPISPAGLGQFGAFDNGGGDDTWATVAIPAYNLIGGDEVDTNAVFTIDEPGWRLTPFEHYPATGDKFVTIIDGQDHGDMWATGSDEVEVFVSSQLLEFFAIYVRGDDRSACEIGVTDLRGTSTDRLVDPTSERTAACR